MQAWIEFLNKLDDQLGKETVDKWLRPLKVIHFDAWNLYLEASDSFHSLWFEEHVRPRIKTSFLNTNGHPIKVHLTTSEIEIASEKREDSQVAVAPRRFVSDTLEPWGTFSTFVPAKANPIAYKLLGELTGGLPNSPELGLGVFNPIFVYGKSGVGKTHLLMATASLLQEKGLKVMYIRTETFTEHVVSAIRSGQMQVFRKAYRNADVLIMDDVHLLARKNATQEEFFHTFNTLHTSGRQIILSANCLPQHLEEIEARLVSRFEWGITVQLESLNNDELFQMVLNRCRALKFPLNREIIEFLITSFSQNTKSLHRAFEALILRSHLNHSPNHKDLNIAYVKNLLGDLLEIEEKILLNPQKIIQAVADVYGIRPEDILGRSQSQEISLPRQIAMMLCREKLKLSYVKIGTTFSRDHSTVMSSIRQMQNKLNTQEKELNSSLLDIERKLEPVS